MNSEPSYANVQAVALDQAVRAAVASGDLTEVRQLLTHMAAEGPDGITWDWLLAVVLFKLRLEAEQQGRPVLAAQYEQMAAAECSPQAIRMVRPGRPADPGPPPWRLAPRRGVRPRRRAGRGRVPRAVAAAA